MGATAKPRFNVGMIVFICFFVASLEGYDIQAFGVAASRLVKDLGLSPAQMGNAASAAMIGLVIGASLGGWIADRVGRKPVLVGSVLAFGVFSVVTAMTHDYNMLLVARILTGIGFGGAMPNLIAIATEISPPNKRAATTTMMFCGMPVGGAVVSFFVQRAGEGLDWRTVFFIGGVIPVILAPLIFFVLPETRPQHDAAADRRLSTALFGGGRAIPTLLLWVIFVLTLIVLYLLLNWLPVLTEAKGLSRTDGATASLAFNLASIPGALLVGFIVDRVGYRWPLVIAFSGLAAGLYGLGRAAGIEPVVILTSIAGFLLLGANYSLYAFAPTLYPPQVRAAASGVALAVGRVGSILGPWIAGQLRQGGYTGDQVIAAMIPVAIVAAVGSLILTSISKAHAE